METNSSKEIYIYQIDKNNIILSVSDNWRSFAEENLGGNICNPINVVGSSIFEFIRGHETKHLYEIIFRKVRDRERPATFPFRCDSPEKRRLFELSVIPIKNDAIKFLSQVIRIEPREPVELLKDDIDKSDELIRMCSMCKKIAISETEWAEIESGISILKLFKKDRLPELTHGLCPSCFDEAMSELDR